MEKITLQPEEDTAPVDFYVVEQVSLGGKTYLLVTDTEEAIAAQEALMGTPEIYAVPEKAAAAAKEYQRLKDALSQAYADWEAAEETLSEATGE